MSGLAQVCEMTMPIRWGDMDAAGHVNNTVYFRFMEQIRLSWLERSGHLGAIGHGDGAVIANASATFVRALHYPGVVVARMYVGQPGRSSWDTAYELFRRDEPETVYATGTARCVWMDYSTGRSTPMPDSLRRAILEPTCFYIE